MFTFANVFHFFAHEFARLSAGRFAFALVFARAFDCFFFWHNRNVSPLAACLDVQDYMGLALTREISRNGQTMELLFRAWPKLVPANAHNSVTDPHHFANRSPAALSFL